METNKSWKSFQSILIMCIIVLIFAYIGFDALIFRPHISNEILTIKSDYENLIRYKIPEIDSTLTTHTFILENQTSELKKLNNSIPKK